MSGTAFVVGAELVLGDKFSPELRRLIEGLEGAKRLTTELQVSFDKLGLGSTVKKMKAEWEEIDRISKAGAEQVLKTVSGLGTGGGAEFAKMTAGADKAFGEILTSSVKMQGDVLDEMKALQTGSIAELKGIGAAAPELFAPIGAAARASATEAEAAMRRVTEAVEGAAGRMRAAAAVSSATAISNFEQQASINTRSMAAHGVKDAHAKGLHFGGLNSHVGGSHVSLGGDGLMPTVAGVVALEGLKQGVEAGFDFRHWVSQFQGNGFSQAQIDEAQKAAWANARVNPNSSATESMKMILEANKMTGNLDESISLLPTLSMSSVAMQSVKAEDLKSHFNDGTQIFNFAKYLEEVNATSNVNDKTPEEHLARTQAYAREAIRTMITSRGVTDGNSLYALSNNSKGASTNWDMQMATTIAPIIGDVMRHAKMGNADYMELKSYQGGHITPDAVAGLMKYGLVKAGRDASQDSKGNWHLNPNSPFAEGIETNIWDWSTKKLAEMKANGYDITDQKVMNGFVNAVGSNGSTSNLMRTTFEPGPRALIQKELTQRDRVPQDAATILQNTDPVLKLSALEKKWQDLLTAVGDPLVDPAISGLTKLTAAINAIAQAAKSHSDITKYGAEAVGVAGAGLTVYGVGRMLGMIGGGAGRLTASAAALDAAAAHLMLVGGSGVPGVSGSAPRTSVPETGTRGRGSFFGKGGLKGVGAGVAEGVLGGMIYSFGEQAIDRVLGWTPENQKTLDDATSGRATLDRLKKLVPSVHNPFTDTSKPSFDPNAVPASGFQPMAYITGLGEKAKATTDTFDRLDKGSGGLDNALKILEATAIGAARALASVAMSGGMGGGSGFINASYGGGGGFGGGGFGGGGGSPPSRGARGVGAGSNPYVGGAGGGSFVPPVGDHLTAGMRNNNLGNIGWFGQHMAGLLGPSNARDVDHSIGKFATQDDGIRAAAALALSKYNKGRHSTWDIIAAKGGWTPGALGPGASVNVARAMGLSNQSDVHLDNTDRMVDFLHGLAVQEHGPAGQFYSKDRIRAALQHGSVPSGGPSKTVSPGRPAAAQTSAMLTEEHHHIYMDGERIAHQVTKRQVADARFKRSVGPTDTYGRRAHPGSEVMDA